MSLRSFFTRSIWQRLFLGFAIAMVLPAIVIVALSWQDVAEINTATVRAFIEETGHRTEATIRTELNEVFDVVTDLSEEAVLLGLLQGIVNRTFDEATDSGSLRVQRVMDQVFNDELRGAFFNSIWVVDINGTVRVVEGPFPIYLINENIEDTAVFTAAERLAVLEEEQDILITLASGLPSIQVINRVESVAGETLGYIMAEINMNRLFRDNLSFTSHGLPAYSFILLPNGFVITDSSESAVNASPNSEGARLALDNGVSGFEIYRTGPNLEHEVIGFYTSIPLTTRRNIALVTEIGTDIVNRQILTSLSQSGLPVILGMFILGVVLTFVYTQVFVPPLDEIRTAMIGITRGAYDIPLSATDRSDEIGALAVTFVDMRQYIATLVEDLTERVHNRVRDVEATQEISRAAATQRNLQTLMNRVVNLIVEKFPNIYHAQIFLLDEERRYAVLRASTGEIGKEMLAHGHRLAVGSVSVIGQVTEEGQIIIARDTATSEVHRENEFLPDTLAELAIPLRFGDTIIGALDVQSKLRNSFTEDQVSVLVTMADQLAVAIQNAYFYEEAQRRLHALEQNNKEKTIRAWEEYLHAERATLLTGEAGNPTGNDLSPLRREALSTGKPAIGQLTERNTIPFAIPITLRGQILGAVEWELPEMDFDRNKVSLAEELVNRLAVSLDNARLFQESQRSAERERIVNDIAAKITGQTDIDEILRIAVREVGQALSAPMVNVHLDLANSRRRNGRAGAGRARRNAQSDETSQS